MIATKPRHPLPSPLVIHRLQRQLHRLVCSAPWFDRCWSEVAAGRLRAKQRLDAALDRALLYPPGGVPRPGRRPTLMRRCKTCGARWYPPQYVRGCRLCEDCAAALSAPCTDERTHISTTESSTAEALSLLAHYQVRLVEPRLPAEDEASLRREIAVFQRRHPVAQGRFAPRDNTKKHT